MIDAREFVFGRKTGIGRFLEGLVDALSELTSANKIVLASYFKDSTPTILKNRRNIEIKKIPSFFLKSEKALSNLSIQGFTIFISPYPKLPLFGNYCPSVHIIHDVLDLTHPAYRKRFKVLFDSWRLKRALRKADLTWYDSSWSLEETRKYAGSIGRNPRVRHLGIDERFNISEPNNRTEVLNRYRLELGYILVIGNGLPHKNPGILLRIAGQLKRKIVFVGVNEERQLYWKARFPGNDAIWIRFITDEDLPAIIKGSFCLKKICSKNEKRLQMTVEDPVS